MTSTQHQRLPFLDNGIAQVAFVVADLERVVESYHRSFGIGPWHFYTYGKPLVSHMTYRGRPADYEARIALSYFGPMRVELIQPVKGPSVYHEFIEKHGYGVQHFGLLVSDMQQALRQAEAAGYPMIMDGAGFGKDGDGHYAYIDTEDEFGIVYELIERPNGRRPPEKIYPPEPEE
jgi:catechol 2,3-dioxygenase-like lactoylglutathione lyase family enzyme